MATTLSTSNSTSKDVVLSQHAAQQQSKILEELTKKHESEIKKREKAVSKLNEDIITTTRERVRAELTAETELIDKCTRMLEQYTEDRKRAEAEVAEYKKQLETESLQILEIYQKNFYKNASNREKQQFQEARAAELKQKEKSLKEQLAMQDAQHERLNKIINSKTASEDEKKAARAERTQLVKDKAQTRKDLRSATKEQSVAEDTAKNLFQIVATSSEKAKKAAEDYAKAETLRQQTAAEAESALKAYKEAVKDGSGATAEQIADAEKLYDARQKEAEAANDAAKAALKKVNAAERAAAKEETLAEKKKRQSANIAKAANMASSAIDTALSNMYDQQARMQGRLQGSNIGWASALNKVSTNIGVSPLASQQKVVEQMVKLVDSGVAYNLELRAFLAETSESIASTFDAFDANLLRLIRLQQADSTAARLGMEATLTKFFNQSFQDSGYLAEQVSDSVAAAILDASATMSRDDSLAFEYIVQKWLGSLYSLGMSSEAVTGIAQGINYLATGNVTALSGNTALQTLFSMSAGRTNKSYTDMLTGGISASETNDLLKSMVELLSGIAENTDNRVLSSAYAELFDMSLTDLRTFSSLTAADIKNIYASTVNYGGLINETTSQLTQVVSRKNMSQIIDTVIENAMTGAAQNIGSNPITYGLWKALNLVDSLVDIEIPGITVVGSGTTSAIDVLNIAKLGFAGMGLVTSLVEALASGSGGATSLSAWGNAERMSSRGSPLSVLSGGSSQGTSLSASLGVGGADASTISDVSFESAQETAHESAGVTSEELQESKETPQKIFDAIAGDGTPTVLSLLQEIDDRLDPGRVFYTAIAGVLSHDVVSTVTNLSSQIAVAKANMSAESSSENTSNPIGEVAGNIINNVTNKAGGAKSADGTSGFGFYDEDEDVHSLQSIIAAAIAEGLQQYGWSNRMPVEVTTQGGAG